MPPERSKKESQVTFHPYSKASKASDETAKPQATNVVGQPLVLGDKKPLEIFFSQYPEFRYRLGPGCSSVTEFHRLCKQYRWEKDGPEREVARYEFNLAMKKEFDSLYGSDEKDINNWHKLCYILSIDPVPDTVR